MKQRRQLEPLAFRRNAMNPVIEVEPSSWMPKLYALACTTVLFWAPAGRDWYPMPEMFQLVARIPAKQTLPLPPVQVVQSKSGGITSVVPLPCMVSGKPVIWKKRTAPLDRE